MSQPACGLHKATADPARAFEPCVSGLPAGVQGPGPQLLPLLRRLIQLAHGKHQQPPPGLRGPEALQPRAGRHSLQQCAVTNLRQPCTIRHAINQPAWPKWAGPGVCALHESMCPCVMDNPHPSYPDRLDLTGNWRTDLETPHQGLNCSASGSVTRPLHSLQDAGDCRRPDSELVLEIKSVSSVSAKSHHHIQERSTR